MQTKEEMMEKMAQAVTLANFGPAVAGTLYDAI